METPPTLSKLVKDALERLAGLKTPKQLQTLYHNVSRSKTITDIERETLVESLELRMREVAPAAATRLFGPKDSEAQQFLHRTYKALADEFDLSANRVRNGVKIGGDMIKGEKFVDVYLSYKSVGNVNVGLAWLQDSANSDRYLIVSVRQVGSTDSIRKWERFEVGQEHAAVDNYRSELSKVCDSFLK